MRHVTRSLLVCTLLLTMLTPQTARAAELDVVVSEIAWMGTTASSADEWIELYNNTAAAIDLTGWTLQAADGTPNIALSGSIPAHGYYLLERTDDNTVPGVAADLIYSGAMENEGEDLLLYDASVVLVDRVDASAGWFSGHDAGVPMVRVDTTLPGAAANWDYNPRCGTATNSAGVSHTCTLTVTYTGTDLDYAVYFNPLFTTATTTTLTHTPMEDALLTLIAGADTTLDATVYGLNRQSVIDALIAAHNRGVTVRVVGDDDAAEGEYYAGYQALISAGLSVITDTSSYIQHNKFIVIDGQVVWTGSTNFTDTGFTLNANNSLAITSTHLAAVYTAEFNEMYSGNFHSNKTDNTAHLLDYNGTLVEVYFSPTDLGAFAVRDALATVTETLHFGMFYWTDTLLRDRAIELLNAGVDVAGMWDQLGAANAYSVDEDLVAAGARVRIENYAGKLHHKLAVLDANGVDPIVITGSYNWTASGGYENDENTLIIHHAALAQAYEAELNAIWTAINPTRVSLAAYAARPTWLLALVPLAALIFFLYPRHWRYTFLCLLSLITRSKTL